MDDASVALLAIAATVIVGLLGLIGVLQRRNNHKNNPNGMWEKLWDEHKTLETEIKSTRQTVREGFVDLGRKIDDSRKEIVDAINRIGRA